MSDGLVHCPCVTIYVYREVSISDGLVHCHCVTMFTGRYLHHHPDRLVHCQYLTLYVCLQGGIYIVTLMDWYTLLLSFSLVSLFEIIAIIYVYGKPYDFLHT